MATSQRRTTLHVDMDQFFAAVEERMRRELRGRPVVASADPKGGKGRSAVSTCNYEAREYGLRSGIPITKAWRLHRARRCLSTHARFSTAS